MVEDRFRLRWRKFRHVRRLLHRAQLFVADQRRVSPAMRDVHAGEILPPLAPSDVFAVHSPGADVVLVAYIKFISGIKISLTEITIRIREALMMNYDLMEILQWDRKTILKPPNWNRSQQMELFGDFLC